MVASQEMGQRAGGARTVDTESASKYLLDTDSNAIPVLSVVIPTMNEEEGIGTCLDWVYEAVEELRVPTEIIISDSSTDSTPEIARERGANVVEPDKPGYGYAYRYAFEQARGDYIVMGDADTTYDFSEIPRLLDHLKETGADMVMGSRLEGEIEPGAMPSLHQYIGNPMLTRFLNAFYDAGVSDAHSGFRVFTAEALEAMDCETDGMEFASEMIMEAGASDLKIEEVPITYYERKGEETLDSFRDGWRHIRFMLVNAPGYLFSIPGLVMAVAGLLVMGVAGTGVELNGVTLGLNSMLAGSLLVLVGYQVGCLGVFASVAGDPIRKPSDQVSRWIVEHLTLEKSATAGLVAFAGGAGYAGWLLWSWAASGFSAAPFTMQSIIAFTGIVLGVQTVFSAFFLSAVE
jgi:hypothetical protein